MCITIQQNSVDVSIKGNQDNDCITRVQKHGSTSSQALSTFRLILFATISILFEPIKARSFLHTINCHRNDKNSKECECKQS